MSQQTLWFGFLKAEDKSSPVIIDHSMDTGEKRTVYIYNHNRKEVLKYVRELVEPKLRELTAEEHALEAAMKKGFMESLKTFNNKSTNVLAIPTNSKSKPKVAPPPEEPDVESIDLDDDDDVWEEIED